MALPLSVTKIAKYCCVRGGGIGGRLNLTKIVVPPLSVIKIVKYCELEERGALGRQNPTQDNAPTPFQSVS